MFQWMSEIKSQKKESRKSSCYLSDTASTLGGTQCPIRWHRRDPHGKEGRIECLFGLQCHQLAKTMGHFGRSHERGIYSKQIESFQRNQKAG